MCECDSVCLRAGEREKECVSVRVGGGRSGAAKSKYC